MIPKCYDQRIFKERCVNGPFGTCMALNSTYPASKACPFYKTEAECEEQLRRLAKCGSIGG